MSKKKKTRQEPWERSIYDTEYDTTSSRLEQRNSKKGNSKFITVLLVLFALIIIIPLGTYFWFVNGNNNSSETKTVQNSSSSYTFESSSSSSSSESESSSEEESTSSSESSSEQPVSSEESIPESSESQSVSDQTGSTYTVKAGDNLYRIAQNYGMSVEELQQLNGLSGTELSVGQSLKVK